MRIRNIPYLPFDVPIDSVHENMKLYTDDDIGLIKSAINKDGRYRHILVDGDHKVLQHAVIYLDGSYIAVMNGKDFSLGRGSFGKVKLGQDLVTGDWCAVKVSRVSPLDEADAEDFLFLYANERRALALSRSSFFTANNAKPFSTISINRNKNIYAYHVAKLIKGVDMSNGHLQLCPLSLKIDVTLAFLHAVATNLLRNVVHRDVKPEHFIYDLESGTGRLIDYGFSIYQGEQSGDAELCGTDPYVDPDLIDKAEQDDLQYYDFNSATDLYAAAVSVGCFWGLIDTQPASLEFLIPEKDDVSDFESTFYPLLSDLLKLILSASSQKRLPITEAIAFFQDQKEQLPEDLRMWSTAVVDVANLDALDMQTLAPVLKCYPYIMMHDSSESLSNLDLLKARSGLCWHGLYVSTCVSSGPLSELHDYVRIANQRDATRRLSVIDLDSYRVSNVVEMHVMGMSSR